MADTNTFKNTIIGRTRRLDTKQFTVTIDLQSNKNQNGIVRIFMGPRINNKQQLNDNRRNFVELDQFIVDLKQGQNVIKRNSRDFKNVVGDGVTMQTLYKRALNTMNNKNGNTNDMTNLNIDTNNNNRGFPHRLLLPKGTVGGEDYTLFVIVSDVNNHNDRVKFSDNLNTRNIDFNGNGNNGNSGSSSESNSDSNGSSDSNSSSNSGSDSNESNSSGGRGRNNRNGNNRNGNNNNRYGNNNNRYGNNNNRNDFNVHRYGNNLNRNGKGNFVNNNGVMIHNNNNGNKNIGNGNGVLDTRAMGYPLDRQIIDITGFVCNNMFFKDVTVFHVENTNNQN
jgi:hypothetical protein